MNTKLIIYLVSFAAFLGPFTQNIYVPILPEIQKDFHTTSFLINMSLSAFTVTLAVMQMVYGPLIDTKGRRRILLAGILIYIGASVGCAFSPSVSWFLLFRVLQAAGIAAGSIVATTVVSDLFEGKQRGRAMGVFQMLVALGPVLGPVIGGWVGEHMGYWGVFMILAVTGTLTWLANARYLPETRPNDLDGVISFGVRRLFSVMLHPIGLSVTLFGFIQFYAFHNFLAFLPQILSTEYGLGPAEKGLVFLPLSLMIVVGSYTGGRLQEKMEARKILMITSSLHALSIVLFMLAVKFSLIYVIISLVLFGLFLGLSQPVQTVLLMDAFAKERATAVGAYNFFRFMGMAAGPLFGSILYQMRNIFLPFGFAAVLFGGVLFFVQRKLRMKAAKATHT
ncbi:MFS transporter [Aneurinibacillus aneurinilyticus]|jgi:MFS family permease|uniref:MFS transporter n=1 Tax=Aneurinibacillus aneurinilyticus TaxID=1391 RepID=UPI0023F96712|nr:MFS transporter [Aneurinibacillus aneurinilyticus]MCI1695912.1 MFS transporter [Aneurinibacillus aneurinilyticus]